jgi:hypothetical protein
MLSGKIEGVIDLTGLPKAMEQNGKLSGNAVKLHERRQPQLSF